MTLKAWRQRSRIIQAMARLARGDAPAAVARGVGFSSTAAFSHASRQVTATTPTAFVGTHERVAGGSAEKSVPTSGARGRRDAGSVDATEGED